MINTELTFYDNNHRLVVIMPNVVQRLLSHRQLNYISKEAAGVLIGERRGIHLVITDLSEPGTDDIRHRYSVDRRGSHHQDKVDLAFVQSQGTYQYLGEWHSHPEDKPIPSYKDRQSWERHLDAHEPMVLIIVGRKELWAGKKERNTIIPLILSEY
ncbi:Mov34/MPN/PAD-1 family protein [Pectobacterium carotovorum]|uniref:CBASS system CD-NTase/cGAS isopeptidase Cap3 n=1 Tax=Pectobacterium carotovorum TaxID=554 RepID=UPI001CF1F569|nr:Mov34/MPN/PAD-1 family protein [Pectobacterium carotovorum]MCA6968408.1 Mov34/MPN/PAD-1 family protein [Pectobacterium carotovorum]